MSVTQLLFSFRGRLGRGRFWMVCGPIFVISIICDLIAERGQGWVVAVLMLTLWPSLAAQTKRWHDRNKSAWWLLISIIPVFGALWALIETGFLPGTVGDNRFGPPAT